MNMGVLRWCCCRVILVLKKQRVTAVPKPVFAKYTDPLYSVERFLQAFPSEKVDFPDGVETCDEKEFVCLPKRATKKDVLKCYVEQAKEKRTSKRHMFTPPPKSSLVVKTLFSIEMNQMMKKPRHKKKQLMESPLIIVSS